MINFYDRDGKRISIAQYGRLFADHAYKRVARDEIGGYVLSTVWLGVDHGFLADDDPPMIFETMLFETPWQDRDCWRWSTEAVAIAGHDQILAAVRQAVLTPERGE